MTTDSKEISKRISAGEWMTYDPEVEAVLRRLARQRFEVKTKRAGEKRADVHRPHTALDYVGLAGEYLISLLLDVPMDTSVTVGGNTSKVDFTWKGLTVMVVCRTRDAIMWPDEMQADVLVLVNYREVRKPESGETGYQFRATGWASRDRFLSMRDRNGIGRDGGKRDILRMGDVLPISSLLYTPVHVIKPVVHVPVKQESLF